MQSVDRAGRVDRGGQRRRTRGTVRLLFRPTSRGRLRLTWPRRVSSSARTLRRVSSSAQSPARGPHAAPPAVPP